MTVISTNHETFSSKTPIQQFYAGQNILITGGTGFVGKLLIEKLLRSCPDISSIYIIIRSKKGQDAYNRLDTLFNDVIFERLKKEMPKFRHKVTAIAGDCLLPGLGISAADREFIMREISIVFHVAATVKFNEKIGQAVAINVRGTKEMMELCKSISNLKSVIYVSTSYCNCNRKEIDEKFYEPPITGDNAIKLVESLNDKNLDAITQTLLGDFPNTYTFSKCIAEQVVQQYGRGMPTGIFRPAIIMPTYREPVSGWTDTIFGAVGPLVGVGAGLVRVLHMNENCTAELVPADLAVNALIATAWDVANNNANFRNEDADPPIYNYHASWTDKFTWGEYVRVSMKHGKVAPTLRSLWCYTVTSTNSFYMYYLLTFFLHTLPAFLVDSVLFVTGKGPRLLKTYKKIHKFLAVISYFSVKKWEFKNANMSGLWDKLTPEDQEVFFFSMRNFDWDNFMKIIVDGVRLYIFKEDPKTIPMALKRASRLYLLHQVLKYTIVGLALWAMHSIISFAVSLC